MHVNAFANIIVQFLLDFHEFNQHLNVLIPGLRDTIEF